ncbi:PASTA domain-containing protein [Glaciibacter superstes]|uniref:PASTA domain-containing protein n=1 Tax=Glaciibacter superstes TaxID=501023 RepID=UPI0003B4B551|nr:PASTA domain-containing protein [Glaciibacter superstes]
MKRTLATIITAAAIVMLITSCSSSAAPVSAPTAAVPDVIGTTGDVAKTQLKEAGYEVEFTTPDEGSVWMPSNWTVDGQDPAAGTKAEAGVTVTLSVSKPEVVAEPVAPALATSTGLTATFAQAACDQSGEQAFPYGFKGHWIVGSLAEEIQDDQWFMKVEATVTNEANAEREYNVECFVSGTNEAPVVTAFNAY